MPTSVAEVFAAVGLASHGPLTWGKRPRTRESGVYVVSLTSSLDAFDAALPRPPFNDDAFRAWLSRCPRLTLDGTRPAADQLKRRIEGFWLPDEIIVYIGRATNLSSRLGDYYRTPIGASRPHSGGYFLKLLSPLEGLWVHYAPCTDPESAEGEMIRWFCDGVSETTKDMLIDQRHPFPFANLEWPAGTRKAHGLRGARESRSHDAPHVPTIPARQQSQTTQLREVSPGTAGRSRTQRVTAADLRAGQIRIPASGAALTKQVLPTAKTVIDVRLRGRAMNVSWDPRMGPDRERSGVLRVGRSLRDLVSEGEVLTVLSDAGGVRID